MSTRFISTVQGLVVLILTMAIIALMVAFALPNRPQPDRPLSDAEFTATALQHLSETPSTPHTPTPTPLMTLTSIQLHTPTLQPNTSTPITPLTLVPIYTPTATPVPPVPSDTPLPTLASPLTPTSVPRMANPPCFPTYNFAVGSEVYVDFNYSGALTVSADYERTRSIADAYDNQVMTIEEGPQCNPDTQVNSWRVRLNISGREFYGWVPETDDGGDPYLCPSSQPECRQYGQ